MSSEVCKPAANGTEPSVGAEIPLLQRGKLDIFQTFPGTPPVASLVLPCPRGDPGASRQLRGSRLWDLAFWGLFVHTVSSEQLESGILLLSSPFPFLRGFLSGVAGAQGALAALAVPHS